MQRLVCLIFAFSFLFILPADSQTEWQATITAQSELESSPPQPLTFAMKEQATSGFDQRIDQAAPPPPFSPMNLDLYFPLNNPIISRLVMDVQPVSTAHDWTFKLRADNAGGTLHWDISQLPTSASIKLILPNTEDEINLRQQETIDYIATNGSYVTFTVSVNIPFSLPSNLQPRALMVDEDSLNNLVTLTAVTTSNFPLNFSIISQPQHGKLSGTLPNLVYQPNADFFGSDSLTFSVVNSNLLGQEDKTVFQSISITVRPMPDKPVAEQQNIKLLMDSFKTVQLQASDADGDQLSYAISTQPNYGQLSSIDGSEVVYTPNNGFIGADRFTFRASDGFLVSTLTIVLVEVIKDPSPQNLSWLPELLVLKEDNQIDIQLLAQDLDPLTGVESPVAYYQLIILPSHGQINGLNQNLKSVSGQITYVPDPDFPSGQVDKIDSFSFVANDGISDSIIQAVTITIQPQPDIPATQDQEYLLAEDTSTSIELKGIDADGDRLSYQIVNYPVKGSLSGVVPFLLYTPHANATGYDSLTYTATDTLDLTSSPSLVSLRIEAVNDAPVTRSFSFMIPKNQPNNRLLLSATDVDNDLLVANILSMPSNGQLELDGTVAIYSPNLDFSGTDSFTFNFSDNQAQSQTSTARITIGDRFSSPVNPSVGHHSTIILETGVIEVRLPPIPDSNINQMTVGIAQSDFQALKDAKTEIEKTAITQAFIGQLKEHDLPDLTDTGEAELTRELQRGVGAIVSIKAKTNFNTHKTNFENNPLTIRLSQVGLANSLILADRLGTELIPTIIENTVDGPVLVGQLKHLSLVFSIVNSPPTSNPQTVELLEDTSLLIILTGQDPDLDAFDLVIDQFPSKGLITDFQTTDQGLQVTYTPQSNQNGIDDFTFLANDGAINGLPAKVEITIQPTYDPVIVNDSNHIIQEDTPLTIIPEVTNPDDSELIFTVTIPPQNGSLTFNQGEYNYQPLTNFFGQDSFTYQVNDGTNTSQDVTVTVEVLSELEPPILQEIDDRTILETSYKEVILLSATDDFLPKNNDVEKMLVFSARSDNNQLVSASVSGNQLVLIPTAGRYGETTIYVTVTDPDNLTDSNSFKVSVLPVNAKPETMDSAWVVVEEDGAVEISLLGQDDNADQLIYTIIEKPNHGELSTLQTSQPNLTYQPNSDFFGADQFRFQASDGRNLSNISTVKIVILPVNDPPQPISLIGDNRIRTNLLQQSIQLQAIDADGDDLNFELISQPKYGLLSGTPPELVYHAPENVAVIDEFSFKVTDHKFGSGSEIWVESKIEVERLFVDYKLEIPKGFSLIHLPLLAMGKSPENINPIHRFSDLYALIGAEYISLLIGYDRQSQRWVSYLGNQPGGQTDLYIRPGTGILAVMKNSVTLDLIGNPLPASHNMVLQRGLNLIGLPLNDNRINQVSDLLTLPEVGDYISTLIIYDSNRFQPITRIDDPGSTRLVNESLGLIVVCKKDLSFQLTGSNWLLAVDQQKVDSYREK